MENNKKFAIIDDEYPPRKHVLRDLRPTLEFQGKERAAIRAPVVPQVCTDQGGMQLGVMATLVDILGGWLSIRAVYPDWIATAELAIHSFRPATTGQVTAAGSLMRSGRTTVVIDVEIRETGSASPDRAEKPLGSAMMTFSRLPRRDDTPQIETEEDTFETVEFSLEGSGLDRPFLDKVGIKVLNEAAGVVELYMKDYLRNSFHRLGGGMIATLADTAGQHAARAAVGKPLVTADLAIHYLSQGKTGPFRTRTQVLRTTTDTALTRVEVIDSGAEDILLAVAMNTAMVGTDLCAD